MPQTPCRLVLPRPPRGYTLTELMIVVTMLGVLAVVGISFIRKNSSSAHVAESVTMLQSLRAAQERYRSINGVYLNASTPGAWYPRDPRTADGKSAQTFYYPLADGEEGGAHPDAAAFNRLGATAPGPVRMGYLVNAGLAGETPTALAFAVPDHEWEEATDAWYVLQAISDLDDDGSPGFYVASSLTGAIVTVNSGE